MTLSYGIYLKCAGCGATIGGEQVTANPEPPLTQGQGGELRRRAALRGWTTFQLPPSAVFRLDDFDDRCPECSQVVHRGS